MPNTKQFSSAMLAIPARSWELLDRAGERRPEPSLEQKFRMLDSMGELARALGALPGEYSGLGFERAKRVARIINNRVG